MRRAVLLLAGAQLGAGIDLLYSPDHACDADLLPKEAKRKMPFAFCNRNEATKACQRIGCTGLATKNELVGAVLPASAGVDGDKSFGMCARGHVIGGGNKVWFWLKANRPNKHCNKGFNGNTADCGGAWCKGCPADAYRNSCACKPENCAPSPLLPPPPTPPPPSPSPSPPPRPPSTCGAFLEGAAQTQEPEGTTLYIFPPPLIFPKWLGAVDPSGTYETPFLDKCCAVCSTGSYGGTAYTFATDAAGNNPATCKSFSLRFIDDISFGYYCQFSSSGPGSIGFTANSDEFAMTVTSVHYTPPMDFGGASGGTFDPPAFDPPPQCGAVIDYLAKPAEGK